MTSYTNANLDSYVVGTGNEKLCLCVRHKTGQSAMVWLTKEEALDLIKNIQLVVDYELKTSSSTTPLPCL